jgi:hypothetical protein
VSSRWTVRALPNDKNIVEAASEPRLRQAAETLVAMRALPSLCEFPKEKRKIATLIEEKFVLLQS